MRTTWILTLALAGAGTAARAADWPQFRGPAGGQSDEKGLPDAWSTDKNLAWTAKLPGTGWSQPVVWGEKVFVTTAAPADGQGTRPGGGGRPGTPAGKYRWEVLCFDRATGKELWKQIVAERRPAGPTHRTNTYASETPAVDAERVYAYFGNTGLFCLDHTGKPLWDKDFGAYPMTNGWGTGSSPALDDERLFVQCDNEEKSFLVALDKKTGKELWRAERDERSGWSTPYLWKNEKRTELVAGGGRKVRSYDPATGKVLWELGGQRGRNAATPVGDEKLLFVGTGGNRGEGGPLFAVKAGAEGDITVKDGESSDAVAWSASRGGPPMASPLLYRGLLYVPDQRGGLITVYEAGTGKQLYRERLSGAKGVTASPWAYDGKVFVLDESGQTYVLAAGKEFKVLGKNSLEGTFWASPAIAGGAVFIRASDHLFCVRP